MTYVPCGRPAPRVGAAGGILVRHSGRRDLAGRKHVGADHIGQRVVGQGDAIRRVGAMVVKHARRGCRASARPSSQAASMSQTCSRSARRGDETLDPVLDPLHRTLQHARRRGR